MESDVNVISEDFYTSHDSMGRLRLCAGDTNELLAEFSLGLKLNNEQLEAFGTALLKAQRKAFDAGRERGLEDKAAEIRRVLGLVPAA